MTTDANELQVDINGAGNATLVGRTKSLIATVDGSGNLNAFDLPADAARLDISGSGDAEVTISGNDLDVEISGAGSVYYKGTPSNIQSRISGAGELIDAN